MKLKEILPVIALAMMLAGCSKTAGELVGVGKSGKFVEANPYGMVFIHKGSFMMGANTQSAVFNQPDNIMMATVESFWMDETEITNREYKQFVYWVRDSIAYTHLINADFEEYAIVNADGDIRDENDNFRINWKKKLPWKQLAKDEDLRDALSPMFYSDGSLKTTALHYRYEWMNYDDAVRPENKFDVAKGCYPAIALGFPNDSYTRADSAWVDEDGYIHDTTVVRSPIREPKDLLSSAIINIYPDTMVWVRDFQNSYNDPMLLKYFSHEGFADYPVVGVTWEQASAFCHWRSDYLKNIANVDAQVYRLPTEAEWEYAARGGRKMATYPWGGNYARDVNGCFLANFKPYRGAYNDDTGTTTMKVAMFRPNDFGLFDMAGNVAEWTSSSYSASSNTLVHDLNPDFHYRVRKSDPDIMKRMVIRGGSWKDISYYLQCGVRTYEYMYESRPYIGFRCVRSYIGE